MKKILIISFLILAIQANINTIKELDIDAYLGTWYEVVASRFVHLTFERNGFCVSATYSNRQDGTINVFNSQHQKSETGDIKSIEGFAYQTDPNNFPGKLKVDLNTGLPGDYWIVELGPIVDGKYDYSIVSEPSKLFMWVLSRDPTTYFEKYGKKNKDTLTKLNFTGLLNKYVERDWTNCVINYEP